ncbi:NifX-associated nitrogen fixation protein [Sinorhizobium sp. 7-81]|uniref:NifX-associated nitrogen fixation protein n=1 Tax=unclassified Sinorhizobium TaxID=2613772 RepID=UPI0024C36F3D|nr:MULTISPECIES: NifX-associated nitrogen fixation protein [unclassified Sinorhizobium]MDK1389272.1 NifX-associated nitrogen fixation protein [Sinorhizobium sp. 7-81]MDK1493551.1 NifX-associated nitrogen fixation protein [Sinorhizobium sp. 8-89]
MATLSDPAVTPAVGDDKALATPFIKCLVRWIRAHDFYGSRENKCDAQLLAKFTVTEEQRRAIPIIGDPDPDVLWRLDAFYGAVGVAIEERAGLLVSRTMEISHEGCGRVLFTTRRLVVLSKTLRDVHRFGFSTLRKLAKTGTKLVNHAVEVIQAYPDLARE